MAHCVDGEKIRKLRIKKGLSQNMLGKSVYVSQEMIAFIENNKRVPSIATLSNISEELGVRISELLIEETTSVDILKGAV